MHQKKNLLYIFLSVVLFSIYSCSDDDQPSNQTDNQYVNTWIYSQMDEWYLWGSGMDRSPNYDIEPAVFFDNLLDKKNDRFSWATPDYANILNWTNAVSTDIGFEYYTIFDANKENTPLYYQIVYTKPNTDAALKGLKRGDKITKVNGTGLTIDNYMSLLSSASGNYSLTVAGKPDPVEIHSMVGYPENPVYYSNIYATEGNKKIGYLVYNSFTQDKGDNSGDYNVELINILKGFYDNQVTDLVLDLRYNGGGLVKCAQNLASAIVKNRTSNQLFIRNEYGANKTAEIEKMSPAKQKEWLEDYFLDKYEIIGSKRTGDIPRLGDKLNKVYILTGKYTASSSELVINGLRPYIDVILIGADTYGKNVASISLFEERNYRNKWGLQPIVMKMYNSKGQSDYADGFTADIRIDEFAHEMKPIGDENEILLKAAIDIIGGKTLATLRSSDADYIKAVSPAQFRKGALDMFINRK